MAISIAVATAPVALGRMVGWDGRTITSLTDAIKLTADLAGGRKWGDS